MLSRIFATILIGAAALTAQDAGSGAPGGSAAIFPAIPPTYKELQQFLSLSDAQVASMRSIQAQRDLAMQAIWKQASDKQIELTQLLQAGSKDYSRIGQLMVEIDTLQRQYPAPVQPYRSQALAVLNPQQKAKLQPLTDALNLSATAYQAVSLNLVDSPQYPISILAGTGSAPVPPGAATPQILPATR